MRSLQYSLLIVLFFVSVKGYAQKTISGTVFNKKTGANLPYATITLMAEKAGVSADVNGRFKLVSVKTISSDTLLVKGLGYLPLKIPINKITDKLTIRLEENVAMLKEIKISANAKEKLLGDHSYESFKYLISTSGQVAKKFERPEAYHFLKDIIVLRSPSHLSSNTKTKFRIKVYDLDSITGAPGESLCQEIIEVEDLDNAEIKIDVSKYNISIPGRYFFVAVEYLAIPYNERYWLMGKSKALYGKKENPAYYKVIYEPCIYIYYAVYRNINYWYLAPTQGSKWKQGDGFPSINVTVR